MVYSLLDMQLIPSDKLPFRSPVNCCGSDAYLCRRSLRWPTSISTYREQTLVNYPQSNAPSPFKSSSMHKISAKALAVEIRVLACPLPNGRETQALLTWTASAVTGAMHIPMYVEQRQLHVQPTLSSQQHLHKRVTSDNGVECPKPSTSDVMLIHHE